LSAADFAEDYGEGSAEAAAEDAAEAAGKTGPPVADSDLHDVGARGEA
jgi:hypothetical protein